MSEITYFSTFSGVGGFEKGIQDAIPGAKCVGVCEIDKHANKVLKKRFPDDWTKYGTDDEGKEVLISDNQRYKMMGNAVTTNVIRAVAEKILLALLQQEEYE